MSSTSRSRFLFLLPLLLLGCASHPKTRSPAQTPAASVTTTRVTQTTELTSESMKDSRALDSRQIRGRVESGMTSLVDRCGALQVTSDSYATKLHLSIDPSGKVESAVAKGSNARLDTCIADVAKTWTFDRAGSRTETNIPLVLERPAHHE